MFKVIVDYSELSLSVRKGLAARQELLTRIADSMEVTSEINRQDLARKRNSRLALLTLPIASPANVRLEDYVDRVIEEAGLPKLPVGLCLRCTKDAGKACNGTADDDAYIEQSGECLRMLKEAVSTAILAAEGVYTTACGQLMTADVHVRLRPVDDCPARSAANFCVSGSSQFLDQSGAQATEVTIEIGLNHWNLNSYAAFALTLAHELICHAAFGVVSGQNRDSTEQSDRFVEGWMDHVARTELVALRHESGDPCWREVSDVESAMTQWRNAEDWPPPCQQKSRDYTSIDRKAGRNQAVAAERIFTSNLQRRRSDFIQFSAAFNAAGVAVGVRNALVNEIRVASSLHSPGHLPFFDALNTYCVSGDMQAFTKWLTLYGAQHA
ncbi:MAG TPA: hypothetical protein VFK05_18475 [Polyangiaceae bacterium]|nr:hypothetical protein [Polyangiaceae bacterium]